MCGMAVVMTVPSRFSIKNAPATKSATIIARRVEAVSCMSDSTGQTTMSALSIIYNTVMSLSPVPIERDSMSDRIRKSILRRIAEGEYRPGHRLVELQLAEEFGTSQAPVREAFRQLEALYVLESKRYCGTRVRDVSVAERQQAYQVRAVLEELAARLAVPRPAEEWAPLRELAEAARQAAERGDVAGYAAKDLPFHRKIVELSGNEVLRRTWEQLGFELQTRIHLARNHANIERNASAHFDIVEALIDSDGERAGRLLRDHAMSFAQDA